MHTTSHVHRPYYTITFFFNFQYKFQPESGTFHSRHLDVSKHQLKISDISYSNGEMTYPTAAENSSAPSFRVWKQAS